MQALEQFFGVIGDLTWGWSLVPILVIFGTFITVATGFVQFEFFGRMFRGLTLGGFVGVDLETLVVLVGAFLTGQACLTTYNSVSTAKHFAQEFTKLAGSRKMSQLMKQQFSPVSMAYAYGA